MVEVMRVAAEERKQRSRSFMMRLPLSFDAEVRARMKAEGASNQSAFWRKAMLFYLAHSAPRPDADTRPRP
ncbi:hypothetical protein BIV57_08095 [Mangrovactinospora gilvigrisea]|uniref:Ribbon-helix-helix protein CopG domain-containing protein n=1 Tax=Mangrovactinospora gilvigrisea TaxID=1428644 RepID=A0A1J7BH18_9ACTN|nr:hypothetical protein [Mangrovactinospora gilvigrisea]OIV37987.1 hypothetical protein BIV57_08095 [Mangrovactinospora gilvigrisea]